MQMYILGEKQNYRKVTVLDDCEEKESVMTLTQKKKKNEIITHFTWMSLDACLA